MKAILFFVALGRVLAEHKAAAEAIAAETKQRVVFRNSTAARRSGEKPEPCQGVAGDVPEAYEGVPLFSADAKGKVSTEKPAKPKAPAGGNEGAGELNDLGFPANEDYPKDRDELKAALDAADVEYHKSGKTEKLVEVYRTEILQEDPGDNDSDA